MAQAFLEQLSYSLEKLFKENHAAFMEFYREAQGVARERQGWL